MMDVMNQTSNISHRLLNLDNQGELTDSLAPIFPPTNFELPDISFSNSVSPNLDFNQSLINSNKLYENSCVMYMRSNMSSSDTMVGQQHGGTQQQSSNEMETHVSQMGINSQHGVPYFFPACSSSPDPSSSDDNDFSPLMQLSKEAVVCNNGQSVGRNNSCSRSPSQSSNTTSIDVSPAPGGASKKGKPCKRKKRKDPNEPQKPVSAYALFFRDSQAAIKGHNPSASFGEVSKIVASMWDQLIPDHKDVYKKKTEMAKKQYLKQLAAYRASQVSQSVPEEAKKTPPPSGIGNTSLGSTPRTTSFQTHGVGTQPESHIPVCMLGQNMLQSRSQNTPTHMSPQMMQHQHQMHNQQQQLQQISMGHASPSSPSQQQHCTSQQQSHFSGPVYSYSHVNPAGPTSYQPTLITHGAFGFSDPTRNITQSQTYHQSAGDDEGSKLRAANTGWDSKYCNSDCVISQCRDVFTNWAVSRSTSNTFPVN